MKISLLIDHPEAVGKIAKWYYNEWAYLSLQITEEMMYHKVLEKVVNRDVIPLAIVAHHENELIGALELKLRENKNYPEYEHWIGGIFVDPLWRGQGVASQMILLAKEKAKELGVTMLYLQCESHNITLYQKHGFKVLHQANHHTVETTIMRYEQ
ncbi:GNAT family N-acetyltransferase [Acinetobacter sp. C26M]|uniref:GNAT family N-acetyltransferase n=1 Tax=unclassified Acinetobacter TaxID=196816 RepID=UPI002036C7F7|nr:MULTISPECIES: GNAT family N-acetyltransferase [unclassified Acinetobacter]USA46587.1 GNAT family N-acetyltransferase [Acinetobacter sp. C26M]USA50071.1 GNAT family N-acetyltransferase [Acinetobacter sp. C26G]